MFLNYLMGASKMTMFLSAMYLFQLTDCFDHQSSLLNRCCHDFDYIDTSVFSGELFFQFPVLFKEMGGLGENEEPTIRSLFCCGVGLVLIPVTDSLLSFIAI